MKPLAAGWCLAPANDRRNNHASDGFGVVVLEHEEERIERAAGPIAFFNDIELARHSELPDAIREQAML